MNTREKFINYVKNGGDKPFVSFQIGAGAGFDCKLAGKEWITDGTLDDTIKAYQIVGGEPFFNIAMPSFNEVIPELNWKTDCEIIDNNKFIVSTLNTPYGKLRWEFKEQKKHGLTPLQYPLSLESKNVFEIVSWYAKQYEKTANHIDKLVKPLIQKAQSHGAVSIQWNIQPFELMGLLSVENLAMLAMLEPENYHQTCDLIREVNLKIIKAVFAAGADFVFLGAPGIEMLSPQIYEEFIVPNSRKITDEIHKLNGLVYCHICSPIEPLLSNGYYNEMGLDLFETLSPPPVGNVTDLAKAREILDDKICTRGNIGLDILLNGNEQEIAKATSEIIEATKGTKHMIAASDYLFYDIPLENLQTVLDTVNQKL